MIELQKLIFQPAPKFHLYKNPLSWKKNAPLLPLMKAKEEEYEKKKDAPTSISLIAGVYGDHSDQVPILFAPYKSTIQLNWH